MPGKPLNEIVDLTEEDKKYLRGPHNWAMRMYFYLNSGLGMTNNFHTIAITLLAVAVVFKNMHPALLGALAFAAVLILIVIGRYNVHRLSKMSEWLNLRFSTHFGIKSFNYQEEQVKLLKEIRDMLKGQQADKLSEKSEKRSVDK